MQNENISNLSGKSDDTLEAMIEYAMLFDFYGALLKDKNNEIFEDYMFNDMSLSEMTFSSAKSTRSTSLTGWAAATASAAA